MHVFYPTLNEYADNLVKFFQQIFSTEQALSLAKSLKFVQRSKNSTHFDTIRPRNFDMKRSRNFDTMRPFNFEVIRPPNFDT